jgi:hypothetical protein
MQKIKAEFVEYVKEILTKTSSSQVGGGSAQGANGAGKAKTQKLS